MLPRTSAPSAARSGPVQISQQPERFWNRTGASARKQFQERAFAWTTCGPKSAAAMPGSCSRSTGALTTGSIFIVTPRCCLASLQTRAMTSRNRLAVAPHPTVQPRRATGRLRKARRDGGARAQAGCDRSCRTARSGGQPVSARGGLAAADIYDAAGIRVSANALKLSTSSCTSRKSRQTSRLPVRRTPPRAAWPRSAARKRRSQGKAPCPGPPD